MRHEPPASLVPEAGRTPAPRSFLRRVFRIRITHAVLLVGAIPVAVATLLGIAAFLLLDRADAAHDGALRVSTAFRQIVAARSARDAYVAAAPAARGGHLAAFDASLNAAREGLAALQPRFDGPQAATIASILDNLSRGARAMDELEAATARNDVLSEEMNARLSSLIALTDEARRRQHDSNADIVQTLAARDARLRSAQAVVDAAQEMRAAVTDAELARRPGAAPIGEADPFGRVRLANSADALVDALNQAGGIREGQAVRALAADLLPSRPVAPVIDWLDRLLKINTTAQRALHDEVAELLTYTVQAHETEQATQNIAIATLKLGDRTRAAVSAREAQTVAGIIAESRRLGETIGALPISPLIQTEMLDALDLWRDGLGTIEDGLARQTVTLAQMGDIDAITLLEVSTLNADLSANAEGIGSAVRKILFVGALLGLLVGSAMALLVARSIARPLKRLEHGMIDRAAHRGSGPLPDADRDDEIGSMARATNYFLQELGKREGALRSAKERTEGALRQLKDTQAELIQAEKLASLGQLVAGVAHEINTPLGVALTTATVLGEEVRGFEREVQEGRVTRDAFDQFVARTAEGARLIHANLERSASLVQSFKQVAVDQASGERRRFEVRAFAEELFTSLGPLIKRAGHGTEMRCEEGLVMDSYPGALAQVLTNLLSNAFAHAFPEGRHGLVRLEIARSGREALRIVFSDDGCGIRPENRSRIFDPFFTTGRGSGSTGLGLHIVFNLVTATLGGTISLGAEGAGGAALPGARFTIDLPLTAPLPAAAQPLLSEDAA